jgi:hypothetical protein
MRFIREHFCDIFKILGQNVIELGVAWWLWLLSRSSCGIVVSHYLNNAIDVALLILMSKELNRPTKRTTCATYSKHEG